MEDDRWVRVKVGVRKTTVVEVDGRESCSSEEGSTSKDLVGEPHDMSGETLIL